MPCYLAPLALVKIEMQALPVQSKGEDCGCSATLKDMAQNRIKRRKRYTTCVLIQVLQEQLNI